MEKANITILWDVLISTGWAILTDHPDIVIENKRERVYPFQCSLTVWQQHLLKKLSKYKDLEIDQGRSQTFLITEAVAKLKAFRAVWGHAPPENLKFRSS